MPGKYPQSRSSPYFQSRAQYSHSLGHHSAQARPMHGSQSNHHRGHQSSQARPVQSHPRSQPSRSTGPQSSQARPVYNPRHVNHDEVQANQEENVYGDSLCRLCSDPGHSVYHHHVSSKHVRDFAENYQKSFLFNCIMCKSRESTIRPSTRKLILTSSTLYNVWTYEELKLPIHLEIEAIVGGRFRDLTRALIMSYLRYPERLEIITVAGINNIGESQSSEDILEEIRELKEAVKAHSVLHGHSTPSIVSVSTILYAPKFCALDVPDSVPAWKPPPGFDNKREVIERVNKAIADMNKAEKVNYLNLHYEGIRKCKKTGKTLHRHNTQNPIWRETEIRRKLHLTPQFKIKVMNRAATLFMGGLKEVGDWWAW